MVHDYLRRKGALDPARKAPYLSFRLGMLVGRAFANLTRFLDLKLHGH